MAIIGRLTSSRFPYLPIQVQVRQGLHDVEALLDTGFDGDVVLPVGSILNGQLPDRYVPCELADGSVIFAPFYRGNVQVGALDSFPAAVVAMGDEPIVGRGVTDRFTVILDYGQRLIVEL